MIAVGMMDKKVSLWRATPAADTSYGGYTSESFSEYGAMWAHVLWKTGKVSEEGEQMQNNQICEFYVRNTGVGAAATVLDYIVFDDCKFYIDYINVIDGRKKYLKIQATQVQPKDSQV